MTADNKTLADVQPDGRVRLGDALLPCPFCGNDAEFVPYKDNGLTLKCKSMGCIQRHQRTLRYGIDWLRTSMTEHWNARVLSAQPSTGGQGNLKSRFTEWVKANSYNPATFASGRFMGDGVQIAWEAVQALAALQPVGQEPVPEVIGRLADDVESCVSDACAYLASNSGWDDYGIYRDDAADRYRALPDRIRALSAPPAQAVDLPYSLDADPAGIRARVCDVITGTLMVGAQGHTPPPVGHWAEPFWQAARADAKAQAVDLEQFRPLASYVIEQAAGTRGDMHMLACQLLALIDSRAAGNG